MLHRVINRSSSWKKEKNMAKDSVYRITELVGTSKKSWEDAAANAVNTASKTLRDLRVAEVIKLDMVVEDGAVSAYRARVALSFKYDPNK
jgi:flavin-binding protein dodecin